MAEVDHATSIIRGRSFSYERSDLDLGPKYGSSSRSQLLEGPTFKVPTCGVRLNWREVLFEETKPTNATPICAECQ